jgi:hypothetical protein
LTGFDRIRAPRGDAQRPRDALFSAPAPTTRAAVHCSRCDATSPLDLAGAARAAFPLFLVAPWRDHPVFAVCPACRHRAWLRPIV